MLNPLQSRLAQMSEEQKIRLYNDLFSTIDGQLVLEDLKCRAFFYVPPDHGASSDRDVFINVGVQKLLMEIVRMSLPLTPEEMKQEIPNG